VVWGQPGFPGRPATPGLPGPQGEPAWTWPPQPAAPSPAEPTGDAFDRAEHDTRAAVTSPWWPTAVPLHRQQALLARLVALPDHSWWLYGAWARWYRRHPADGRWYPCVAPHNTATRRAALTARPGHAPPPIPAEILPTGPDFAHDYGPPLAVAGKPVSGALVYRLRSVLQEAAQAPGLDYPLGWSYFRPGTPSTVAATWSAMLWCAAVPVFDPDVDTTLLDLWEPCLAQPFDDHGRLRWMAPPPLRTIIGLYAERMRAGRPDAAGQLVRCMVMTAQALRDDPRFRVRAAALLSIIEPLQANPALDHAALPYGDEALERAWTSRCPPALAATLFTDTAPGERFQLAFYDFATALTPVCGDPGSTHHIEPRHAAVALLAADMAGYRPDLAATTGNWLDPEQRGLLTDVLQQTGHRLRKLWPARGRLPEDLRPADTDTAVKILSAAAAVDFAWCRLAHGIPIPPDGFTVPHAYAATLDDLRPAPSPETTS
jgi:hypothetical protein